MFVMVILLRVTALCIYFRATSPVISTEDPSSNIVMCSSLVRFTGCLQWFSWGGQSYNCITGPKVGSTPLETTWTSVFRTMEIHRKLEMTNLIPTDTSGWNKCRSENLTKSLCSVLDPPSIATLSQEAWVAHESISIWSKPSNIPHKFRSLNFHKLASGTVPNNSWRNASDVGSRPKKS